MNEQVSKLIKNPAVLSAFVGTVGFGAGAAVGYILGRRNRYEVFEPPPRLGLVLDADDLEAIEKNNHFSDSSDKEEEEEDEEKKEFDPDNDFVSEADFNRMVSAKDFIAEKLKTPSVIVEETIEVAPEVVEVEPEVVASNIFAENDDGWDYEAELAKRNPRGPYVIHKDEFFNEETDDFHQSTLTWYDGDKTLADEDEKPVYNHHDIIGPFLFGHGSGDPNVFYVRNERLHAEYEILYDERRFEVEVLGLQLEAEVDAEEVKRTNGLKRFSPSD
jgi:hypothetical protein